MAEYIKRKDLDFLNDFRIDSGKYVGLRLDDVFDELPTADVIERSKINKAISEIEKEIARYGTKGMYYCGLNYAIKVLKEI